MPRKRRRFSRLSQSLKDAKGNVGTDGRLAKYADFITGKTEYNVSKDALNAIAAAGGRSGSYGVALKPFNIETPTDKEITYFASYTKYSKNVLDPLALSADAGHSKINNTKTKDDYTYSPAIIIAHIKTSTESKETTSQITGKSYKRYAGKSGTIPFGCKTDYGEKEDTRKIALMKAAKDAKAYTVTYQPEEWNAPRMRMKDV